MNTQFIKTINGKPQIKSRKDIVVNKMVQITSPEGLINYVPINYSAPNNEMLFEDGWQLYEGVKVSEEQLISNEREHLRFDITNYDASENVNVFYIGDISIWLDKNTRAGLMLRFNSELALKKEKTTLWYNNNEFVLPINSAIQMLYALENYASECYDNTQRHLSNIEKIETLEELKKYDITTGYPNKLTFNLQ
jgi:hypothetical protein